MRVSGARVETNGAGWLTVDDTPLVLAATDVLAIDNDGPLRADNGKGKELLLQVSCCPAVTRQSGISP